MPLYQEVKDEIREVDVIIVGGGSAGCIVAARLADADPNLSVLLVERGIDNYNKTNVIHPACIMANLMPQNGSTGVYMGKTTGDNPRDIPVLAGNILGGGSSANLMTYTRPQRSDFDCWNTPGWTADDMIPYLKKFETYHGPDPDNVHGHDGPIHISTGTFVEEASQKEYLAASKRCGWPEYADIQNLRDINGAAKMLRYVSPAGRRSDAAHAYIHPRLRDGKHGNLHVLVESPVDKIIFEEKRAVGIELAPKGDADTPVTLKARRLVIASAGAIGTPLLLQRSGVGSASVLEKAGVPLIEDIPGVGAAYEDHVLHTPDYYSNLGPDQVLDGVTLGQIKVEDMIREKNKLLGWNGTDMGLKLRPTDEEVAALGPEFQKAWDSEYKLYPDRPLMMVNNFNSTSNPLSRDVDCQYFTIGLFSTFPLSRGHVYITSPSASDPIDFIPGFYSDAAAVDLKKARWAYKKQREIARRAGHFRGEHPASHPPFPETSAAVCKHVETASPEDVKDIEYTSEDDKTIDEWLLQTAGPTWHGLGSTKMAPKEKGGVVDAGLGVYGLQGLKIADLGIAPGNVAANTNSTALAIGEKAADLFIAELGLA